MSYFNDPREMSIRPESGVTLEQDNRVEEMYHWGAMVVDLCDMPVEEYMKPMTVICLGGNGEAPDTGSTTYTLKFVVDGVVVGQETLASGDAIPFTISGEKEGRNFLGWFYGSTKYEEGSLMPSRNLTLTAKYSCNVSFIFSIDGIEEEVSAYTVSYNTKPIQIPSTSKEGYKFLGWEPSTANTVTEHVVYKGVFEAIVYTVTWSGYTNGVLVQEYKYGETLIQPINPEKEGYTFKGWDKAIPEIVTSNIQFNAKFEINKYTVSYHLIIDGIESDAISSTTLVYNSTIPSKKEPIQSGYTFTSWIGYNAETGEVFEGNKMPSYDIKYVSTRTTNEYILSYYDNNELIQRENYLYGSIITPFNYEKEGWTVSEWTNLPETMPYYNVDVHCTSVINTYKVTFKDQDNNEYVVDATYGTPIKNIIPTIEGKTFNISSDILNSSVGASDMVIEGEVTINNYKVNVEGIEGVEIPEELPYGTNVEEYFTSNYPAEEGYYIIVESNHETVPADDSLTVKITYKPNIWVLSYATTGADDNNYNGSKEVAYNTSILPELDTKIFEGYDFKGWFNADTLITEEDKMPNNDLSVNGVYEIMSFAVVVKDGEIEVLNKDYVYGTKLQVILDDIEEYRDDLFVKGYETIVDINPEDVVKSNMEINIEKIEREFVLTFMNGENIISSAMVKFNTTIVYPEMSGYTENGTEYVFIWEDSSYNGKPMPATNVTIIGKYQEKAVAPVYFGSFKVSKSAYTQDNILQYFNPEDVENPAIYSYISTGLCLNEGVDIEVSVPIDEEMKAIYADSAVQGKKYQKLYYRPLTYVIPAEVDSEYLIELKDAIGTNITSTLVTDKQKFEFKGNEYVMYVYQTDVTCIDIKLQVYKQHFRLIKKHNVIINDGDTQVLNKAYEEGTELSVAINDDLVVNYLSELNENGYKGVIQKDGKEINVKEKIVNDIILEIKRIPNEYKLTFMNGDNIISEEMVAFKSDIIYPTMESYTENGVEYYFRWEDESYNGKTMPNMDLIIKGKYVAKLEPVVYFGSFKVAKSAYTQNDLIQYFDIKDIENTAVYNYISTGSCIDGGIDIEISVPIDEEMKTIYAESAVQGKKYQKLYYRPLAYLIPADINNEYSIELKDAIGTNISATLVTDNKIITYNDVNYVMYVYQTDVTCIDIKDQVYKQHFTLIKK